MAWKPLLKIPKVLVCIQSLLSAPNLEDPLDEEINEHYKTDLAAA